MPAHDTVPGFRWDAADYARSSPAQKQWARELIQKINLSGRERVLDIGCGDGTVTAAIAECVPGRIRHWYRSFSGDDPVCT